MHTDVDFRAVYPNINLDNQHSEQFFRIQYMNIDGAESVYYYVTWNSMELGTMRQHNYDGTIPITVGIRDILGNSGTITINGQTFDTPTYVADVVRTRITDVNDGVVGAYDDIFTNIDDVDSGSVSFQELEDDFSASQSRIIAYVDSSNLGWSGGSIEEGQTLQQSMVGGSQKGVEFHNPTISDSYRFDLSARIQPEVSKYSQYNDIRAAEVKYWTWGLWAGDMDILVSPHTYTAPERIVAIHTENQFIHWNFEIDVEFVATVESTAELTQAILDDPFLRAGDMIWDVGFTGDYEVDIALQKRDPLDIFEDIFGDIFDFLFGDIFSILIVIIVVGVGIYIFIKVIPTIQKRKLRNNPKRNGY